MKVLPEIDMGTPGIVVDRHGAEIVYNIIDISNDSFDNVILRWNNGKNSKIITTYYDQNAEKHINKYGIFLSPVARNMIYFSQEFEYKNNSYFLVKNNYGFGILNKDFNYMSSEFCNDMIQDISRNRIGVIENDNKYGVIDSEGNVVIESMYNEIIGLKDYHNDNIVFVCKKEDKSNTPLYDILSENGNILVTDVKEYYYDTKYDCINVTFSNNKKKYINFNENSMSIENNEYSIIKTNGKYGLRNVKNREWILFYEFDEIKKYNNIVVAKKDNKYGLVNISSYEYDSMVGVLKDYYYPLLTEFSEDSFFWACDDIELCNNRYLICSYNENKVLDVFSDYCTVIDTVKCEKLDDFDNVDEAKKYINSLN